MIRNLKVLGFALAAVFAMNAMTTSPALAVEETQGVLTSDGPVNLMGSDLLLEPSTLEFSATQRLECIGNYGLGVVNETPHFSVNLSAGKSITTLTITPTYISCFGVIGASKAPATVTMNGCDYVAHIQTTNFDGNYSGSIDVVCPAGKRVEIHIYSNNEHKTSICTYTLGAQTGKTGIVFKNEKFIGEVTLGGTATGLKATRDASVLCGKEETTEVAKLKMDVAISGGATAISISENGI
jgi:hypothetical protein